MSIYENVKRDDFCDALLRNCKHCGYKYTENDTKNKVENCPLCSTERQRCHNEPSGNGGRCNYHGGASLKGIESPRFMNGKYKENFNETETEENNYIENLKIDDNEINFTSEINTALELIKNLLDNSPKETLDDLVLKFENAKGSFFSRIEELKMKEDGERVRFFENYILHELFKLQSILDTYRTSTNYYKNLSSSITLLAKLKKEESVRIKTRNDYIKKSLIFGLFFEFLRDKVSIYIPDDYKSAVYAKLKAFINQNM